MTPEKPCLSEQCLGVLNHAKVSCSHCSLQALKVVAN